MKTAQPASDALSRYSGVDLRHLRLVWTVAETRSLTRAAERLRLTPSALSHQLRAIEQVAGGQVFYRDGKAMRLTPAGDILLDAAVRVLRTLAEAEERLAQVKLGQTGTVRLSTHCYTGYHWLPGVIRRFRAEHPQADVRVVGDATHRALDALNCREIDVAVTPQQPESPHMRVRPVLRDEVRLIVARDHPLAGKPWVEPADIAREHLLLYTGGPEESSLCVEVLRPAGVWPRRHTNVRLTEAIVELVKAGMGVAALADWAAAPYLADGAIVAKRITRRGWQRTWNAITWPEAEAGPLVMSFVKLLAEEFGRQKPRRGDANRAQRA